MNTNFKKFAAGLCAASSLITCLTSCSDTKEVKDMNSSKDNNTIVEPISLSTPEFPEIPPYPVPENDDWNKYDEDYKAWSTAMKQLREQPSGYDSGYNEFLIKTCASILNGNGSQNPVYSPIGLYTALAMAAEVTDGDTRDQILDLLTRESMDDLRKGSASLWQANYVDDGSNILKIGTSLWTNNKISYNDQTLADTSKYYYASTFTGDPTDEEYNKMYQAWLNEQTDGLLSDQVADMRFDPTMVLNIVSTINYKGTWSSEFRTDLTSQDIFHTPDGNVTCDFMHQSDMTCYLKTDKFEAIDLGMIDNGGMRLILPAEGITPEDLMNEDSFKDILTCNWISQFSDTEYTTVNLSVPKFDVTCSNDLKECLQKLGVKEMFDEGTADFSPLTSEPNVYVNKATQDARVIIDEKGCKAAAITVFAAVAGAMEIEETVDLKFDRPFIFEIISETGTVLFTGIINNPVA